MALWIDIIDPATLTGYVREALSDIEARKGSLARYLPNREVADIQVRFVPGQSGLVAEAEFRAYDAEPKIGKRAPARRVTLELPAIGQGIPVSEYEQLRNRNAGDPEILAAILTVARQVALAISDRMERLRGIVLRTGIATIPELATADSFGRTASHTVVAAALWNTSPTVSRLTDLQAWSDTYETTNGVPPGRIVLGRSAYRVLAQGDEFRTNLVGGGSRPATQAQVNEIVEGAGLAPIEVYTRRTSTGLVLPGNELLLLPEPVAADAWEDTELGATFWGRTLSSQEPDWDIEDVEQPGVVVGVFREPKPPMVAEVISDAIGMPVLANADLSFKAQVTA